MSRTVTDLMQTPDGNIASDATLQLAMPNSVVYENLYLDTNIPYDKLKTISVMNGSDDYLVTSGKEIIDVFEKHRGRDLNPATGDFIPVRFADPDANTLEGQELCSLVTEAGDSWLFQVELSTLPSAPSGGWYLRVWAETSSIVKGFVQDGQVKAGQRRRMFERRLDRKVLTAGVDGENTFDKLIRGADKNIRTIYIKGDISQVTFEGKRNGNIAHRWKLSSKLNSFLQKIRGQKNGIADIPGYLIIDPIATGFAVRDMMPVAFEEIIMKLESNASGPIEILTDYVRRVK
ncbi:major capsid protein P2 [Oceanospirillum sediminis]|uniref:Uncharacterized protein n=1 Tax=Oceanospirillum sediminis TaxID=2760088 RepID=A0A839INR0_9GAMM|nr:major capsid protein P2 [Oceanospirillum sediminis]MBB1485916.1 hypothetical protein [Oceanospirillum sediminis]